MAAEWKPTTLGEFVALQRGHDLTDLERRPGRVPVMGSAGQNGFHDTALAKGPGLVIGRSGASFGRVHYCPFDYWPHNTALYVTDFKGNNPRFAHYFLTAIDFSHFNSGSAQPSLNRNYIYTIPVRVPPPREQALIASILGSLDDKIELNQRMNETLEAMNRALFKSWFIDFDPVRAKADGGNIRGMDEAVFAHLPDQFQDSALGFIPQKWEVRRLDDLAIVVMGLSPKGDSYNTAGHGVALINGPVEFGDYFPVRTKWTDAATRLAGNSDLIFCVRGSTTGRRVVSDGEYCIGRGVCAIRPKRGLHSFVYQTVNFGLDRLLEKTTGSVFPSLSGPDIKSFPVLIPGDEVLQAYEQAAKPLIHRVQHNHRQARTLTIIRDTLLPKLLSGELRIKDAERFVKATL